MHLIAVDLKRQGGPQLIWHDMDVQSFTCSARDDWYLVAEAIVLCGDFTIGISLH